METGLRIAQVAALVGDPARANMLVSLMSGRALTASELAYAGGVSPQTASGHLAKLSDAGLLAAERQGRHRYFRIASPLVGRMVEALMLAAPADASPRTTGRWRHGEALRTARTCYDHMAGRVAVGIADSLVARSFLVLDADGGQVTEGGQDFLRGLGIALPKAPGRRAYCRPCLDWSERRPHVAGAVGAALLAHALGREWVSRPRDGRALVVTAVGRHAFAHLFGVEVGHGPD